jgi:hypothetical protein
MYERFWGYFLHFSHTADDISSCILEQLFALKLGTNPKKCTCHRYDGVSVMEGNGRDKVKFQFTKGGNKRKLLQNLC